MPVHFSFRKEEYEHTTEIVATVKRSILYVGSILHSKINPGSEILLTIPNIPICDSLKYLSYEL